MMTELFFLNSLTKEFELKYINDISKILTVSK